MLKLKPLLIRTFVFVVVTLLLGFYPAYLRVMHALCGIVSGQPIRYL